MQMQQDGRLNVSEGSGSLEIIISSQSKQHSSLMNLVSSSWFVILLQYLSINDIAKLDSAFSNHDDRIHWLLLLAKHSPNVKVVNNNFTDNFVDWLISKKIRTNDLHIVFNKLPSRDIKSSATTFPQISDKTIIKLINNSPNLKRLSLNDTFTHMQKISNILANTLSCYTNLENLQLKSVKLIENDYVLLSQFCHQLRELHLEYVALIGINSLLQTNKNLETVLMDSDKDYYISGDTFETLGQFCPKIKKCTISFYKTKYAITNTQIEIFTKGCRYMEYLMLADITIPRVIIKLLSCLGTYNPLLKELILPFKNTTNTNTNTESDVHNSNQSSMLIESIKVFSICCFKLKRFEIYDFPLSTQGICHLINNCTQLEDLNFDYCDLCKDGLMITKDNNDSNKLQNLKSLDLSYNFDITDESLMNLIEGCYNLETIWVYDCFKLTDASLICIAANCSNLKQFGFSNERDSKFTDIGLNELINKCLNLDTSNWVDNDFNINNDSNNSNNNSSNNDNNNDEEVANDDNDMLPIIIR